MLDDIKEIDFYKEQKENILNKKKYLQKKFLDSFDSIYDELNSVVSFDFKINLSEPKSFSKDYKISLTYMNTDFLLKYSLLVNKKENKIDITPIINFDVNSFQDFIHFNNVYSVFNKHIEYISKNEYKFIQLIINIIDIKNKILNIQNEIQENQHLCFLSENIIFLRKVSNIFKPSPILKKEELSNFILKKYNEQDDFKKLILSTCDKGLKIQFMTYVFEKNFFKLTTESFRVLNVNSRNYIYRYEGQTVSESFILDKLKNSFLYRGKRVENQKDLPIKLSKKGLISYEKLKEELEVDILKENISDF